jgi:hypothetical protein
MQALAASLLLDIWENGVGKAPVEQALVILGAACPQASRASLADLTIGQRDACLLYLHELTFGSQLQGLADCPACQECLELTLDTRAFLDRHNPPPDPEMMVLPNPERSFCLDAYEVRFRLPTSRDLMALAERTEAGLTRQRLMEACILGVRSQDESQELDDLPAGVLEALGEHLNEAESLAALSLAATCPVCGHTWQIIFDIVSFFWSEISAWARRLMREVHLLAMAYGWREADILAMSAWRRHRYLELIGI